MKQLMLTFLLTMLISMVGAKSYANDYDIAVENEDGVTIYYNYINEGKELEVIRADYKDTINIPESVTYMNRSRKVTSIGNYALSSILSKSITIPNSIKSIGSYTFRNCKGLESFIIPNSVTTIGNKAFDGCSGLISITFSSGLASIGEEAFHECNRLKKVIVKDIAAWCAIDFKTTSSNPLNSAHHLYSEDDTEINDLIIPNGVTSIGKYAFYGCTELTSVTIPNSITFIGSSVFSGSSLKKVIVKDIAAWCTIKFEDNPLIYAHHLYNEDDTEIKDLVIPNNVTSISNYAFLSCSGLTSIIIPNSITSIGDHAFDCENLATVTSLIVDPMKISPSVFSQNTLYNASLIVPEGSIEKYKATQGWKEFIFIEETHGTPAIPTCETPTISYSNGKLLFNCVTEGATCVSSITDTDITSYDTKEVQLSVTYIISVYATKAGYNNSEKATASLCWIELEPKMDGITNNIANVPANAILIMNNA